MSVFGHSMPYKQLEQDHEFLHLLKECSVCGSVFLDADKHLRWHQRNGEQTGTSPDLYGEAQQDES